MKNKIIASLIIASIILPFSACNKDAELSPELLIYKNQLTQFYNSISVSNSELNKISYTDEASIELMLNELDKVDAAFTEFGEIEVPKEYESTEELAAEASKLMSEAVALYHEALEGEEVDTAKATQAYAKYTDAIDCVSYIGDILQGQTPVGENLKSD